MAFQETKRLYTPGRVWEILHEGSEDVDELIDVQVGLTRLNPSKALFLIRMGQGFTGEQAMAEAHLTGNQTRLKQQILMKLAQVINDGED